MSNPSPKSVEQIQQELLAGTGRLVTSAQRLVRWRAVVVCLSLLLVALIALVLLDWGLRREEAGLRILFAGILATIGGAATVWILMPAWRFSCSPVEVARWVESQQPALGERLSTAVQFSQIDPADSRYGSSHFRGSALSAWQSAGVQLDWDGYLDKTRWWRAVTVLAVIVGGLATSFAVWPEFSWLGLRRVVLPFSSMPWPRADRLAFLDPPAAVPLGSELQLEVVDLNSPMPPAIDLQVRRLGESESQLQTMAATMMDGLAVATLAEVTEAIEVRAIGGDDDTMAWHRIEVVQPPALAQQLFRTYPPDYAGQAAQEIVGSRIRVLAGTGVTFTGRLSEPVRGLAIKLSSTTTEQTRSSANTASPPEVANASTATQAAADWQLTLDADGQSFRISAANSEAWVADRSLAWQLEITTADDLRLALPGWWSIEVVPDLVPVAALQPPLMSDVAADGAVKIFGRASDDLGLVRVTAFGSRTPPASGSALVSDGNRADEVLLDSEEPTVERELLSIGLDAPKDYAVDDMWRVAAELDAAVDEEFYVWLEAEDALGQIGRSQPQKLAVRAASELLSATQQRERKVLERLRELADAQRRNLQLAGRSATIVEQTQQFARETADAVTSVSQIQESLRAELSESETGVVAELSSLVEVLEQNQLGDSEQSAGLGALRAELQALDSAEMAAAVEAARSAASLGKQSLKREGLVDQELSRALQSSSQTQRGVLSRLEALVDQLSRAESAQQVRQELADLLALQRQLLADTEALQLQQVAGGEAHQLEQSRAGLGADQQAAAQKMDDLLERIAGLESTAEETAMVQQLEQARQQLEEQRVGGLMRTATDQIAGSQLTKATNTQREVVDRLAEALSALGGVANQQSSLAGRAERLRQASEALSELSSAQADLAQQMQSATSDALADLAEDQAGLQDAAQQQSKALQQQGEMSADHSMKAAQQAQQQASESLEQNDREGAAQAAEQAADELAAAAESLAERQEQMASEVQKEQFFQLAQALERLVSDQRPVVDALAQLAENIGSPPTNVERDEALATAARQEGVRQQLEAVRRETDRLPAFSWALEQADADMSRAVAAAGRFRLDPDATQAADAALRKLELAAEAIRSESPPSADGEEQEQEQSAEASSEQDGETRLIPPVASLKLLRALQLDINDRTEFLQQSAEPALRRNQLLRELSQQQEALGVQLGRLIEEFTPPREGN